MAGYEYGNARLRAMKSRLLDASSLHGLAGAESLDQLAVLLTHTPYRESIETALAQATGLKAINQALKHHLVRTMRQIRTFFKDEEGHLISLILRAYDVHNLKTILRGLANQAAPAEITAALLPIGDIPDSALVELATAPTQKTAIDLLATLREPIARPLLDLRFRRESASTAQMEVALDRWHLDGLGEFIASAGLKGSVFEKEFKMEADLLNLMSVLRLIPPAGGRPGDGAALLPDWLVGGGNLPPEVLIQAAGQTTLAGAVRRLAGAGYGEPLRVGLERATRTGRVSDVEGSLRRYRLRWLAGLPGKDPLGPGVPMAYIGLKVGEINSLRWVANGIDLGLARAAIEEALELIL